MSQDRPFWTDPEFSWRASFNETEIDEQQKLAKTHLFEPSGFSFLDEHFGPRPGCLHTLLGSTGKGKSTLTLSLVLEWTKTAHIALYLTEETAKRTELKLSEKEADPKYLSPKLHMIQESDILETVNPKDYQAFLNTLILKIRASNSQMLIIDNLTTSQFYEGKFQNITPLLAGLRQLAKNLNIPIFLITHTKKGVSETSRGRFRSDDIRGSAQLSLTSDYFYSLIRIRSTSQFGSVKDSAFVYIEKCRDGDTQDRVYRLSYDIQRKRYTGDCQINYQVFNDEIKERDK